MREQLKVQLSQTDVAIESEWASGQAQGIILGMQQKIFIHLSRRRTSNMKS